MATRPTLNLGCGGDSWGDVRVDIGPSTQTGIRSVLNIRADAHRLPFRNSVFSNCRCWHVLEHAADPAMVVSEIRRVSQAADVRFPVHDGYLRETIWGLLNLPLEPRVMYERILESYRTRRTGAHLWIIRPRNCNAAKERVLWFAQWYSGRKGRITKYLLPKWTWDFQWITRW